MNLLDFIKEKTISFIDWGEEQAGDSEAADRLRKAILMYGHLYVLEQMTHRYGHLEREEAVARLKQEAGIPGACGQAIDDKLWSYINCFKSLQAEVDRACQSQPAQPQPQPAHNAAASAQPPES
jgi:hypothetical protein